MRNPCLMTICAGIATCIIAFSSIGVSRAQEDSASAIVPGGDTPEVVKKPNKPINIQGCWLGPSNDSISGAGTVGFKIKQSGATIVRDTGHNNGSRIVTTYDIGGGAMGPLSGKISGTAITFKGGPFKAGCSLSGMATIINSNEIQGDLDYTGCDSGFGHVIYQVAHCVKGK